MIKSIQSILTGVDGTLSSKRIVFILLVLVFVGVIIVNLVWKRVLDDGLRSQLFDLITIHAGLVFGEPAMSALKSVRGNAMAAAGEDKPKV
jgi:hypothetical protein